MMETSREMLNLQAFRDLTAIALATYQQLYDDALTFGAIPEFTRTPEKPNTARAVIPVAYEGTKVGDLYAIVFSPGDGTGDANTYTPGSLAVPQELQYREKPDRVIPRSKQGIAREGCFPLFSIRPDGTPVLFALSLEELTVDTIPNPQRVVHGWVVGTTAEAYARALETRIAVPRIYCTTGTDSVGRRFGDPHAIYNSTGTVQVAGFLALGMRNPLLPLADSWNLPQRYR